MVAMQEVSRMMEAAGIPGQDAHDPAEVDVPGDARPARALEMDLLEHPLLEERHPRLEGVDVDEDVLAHGSSSGRSPPERVPGP